jgi:1-acyl-sn-glycerol-3-phosphate acyltransferase
MQDVLIEKPYQFVPAIKNRLPARWFIRWGLFQRALRKSHGVVEHECRHVERLRNSLNSGHGVMLTANHPRLADALSMGFLARETPCEFYVMASWHLFNQGWFNRLMLRSLGGFSVNREGLDRKAIDEAVRILQHAERPLLIFPEGTTSRTNDQLMALMDGPSFIARAAAKRRAKSAGGRVVVHPVALKYVFRGDLEATVNPVLTDIEKRLTWPASQGVPLVARIVKIGQALLTLKELQYHLPTAGNQTLRERQTAMVDRLLEPLEREWLGGTRRDGIAVRIKNLRMRIFPELSRNQLADNERQRRWQQLQDTYLAQQIDCYPDQYLTRYPSVDRILETVEKFEEDLTDCCRIHGNLKVIIDVGEPIAVPSEREPSTSNFAVLNNDSAGQNPPNKADLAPANVDPLSGTIKTRLEQQLLLLQSESQMYQPQGES